MRNLVAAMDGVAPVEEDRMRHWRHFVFARIPDLLQTLRTVRAVRRFVAPARGRHWPLVTWRTVNRDAQMLSRFIYADDNVGLRRAEAGCEGEESEDRNTREGTHTTLTHRVELKFQSGARKLYVSAGL